jgi:nitrate reductase cytochrome c-type subunit
MPFRRWFAERGAGHPAAYSLLVLALGMVVCMAAAVAVSNANTNRALARMVESEKRQEAEDAAAREASRAASCRVIAVMAEAYVKDPPPVPSETYENVSKAWADLAKFC